jgi:hypothetical protein
MFLIEGTMDSYPSRGRIALRTYGLAKDMVKTADACIPGVWVNKSIVSPVKNPSGNNNRLGRLKGKTRIK